MAVYGTTRRKALNMRTSGTSITVRQAQLLALLHLPFAGQPVERKEDMQDRRSFSPTFGVEAEYFSAAFTDTDFSGNFAVNIFNYDITQRCTDKDGRVLLRATMCRC